MKRFLKTLLGFNALSIGHLLRGGPFAFQRAAGKAFSSVRVAPLSSIPEITLDEILGARSATVRLFVSRYEDGILPRDQALALLSILVAEAPAEVLEIGTFMGHTTRQMAENLPAATIHSVDLPLDFPAEAEPEPGLPKDDFHLIARRSVGREFRGAACASRIHQHFADTSQWDFAEAGHPEFFFIDGSHTYEYCRNDSEKCLALCGGRGVFIWHDCDNFHPGVVRFINEWRALGRDIRLIAGTPLGYWKAEP